MLLAKVIGTVVATRKNSNLIGSKFMIVETIEQMKDCSVVTATYRYGGQNIGSISVVGPMRMDYDRVIATLDSLVRDVQQLFNENEDTKTEE